MNELLNKINETFDNCMANSNDDTKLQLRILKNNINALFAEYETSAVTPRTSYDNIERTAVQDIVENDFDPSDVQYEVGIEFEDVATEEQAVYVQIPETSESKADTYNQIPVQQSVVVEEPIIYNQSPAPIPEIEGQYAYDQNVVQLSVVKEPASYNPVVAPAPEEMISVNIQQSTIPMPHPVQQTPQTMQEVFAIKNDKHNILIVDDSSIVRNYLERVFSEDYNVHLAVDGKDAIEKISNDDFIKGISLILLDLMMPNIDGFGVLEYISGRQLNVPIMIISGDNSKETINRAFQYNVVDVIEKPFDAQKIKDKMDRFINL